MQQRVVVLVVVVLIALSMMVRLSAGDVLKHDYGDALSKSILFFEGQRSGKLPSSQRMRWRKDSALSDGHDVVGNPYGDHNCWERPEDMDTPRTTYAVSRNHPGSEVAAEIAAALASSSIVFRTSNLSYSLKLLKRAIMVFDFADRYRGSYNDSLGPWVCPFYCDYSGYQDELLWAAAWLHRASRAHSYWKYIVQNIHSIETVGVKSAVSLDSSYRGGSYAEFGWDSKHAGINILISKLLLFGGARNVDPFLTNADKFVCSVLPESPTRVVQYSAGGLLFKPGGSNLQHATALSFLLLVYARNSHHVNRVIHCGDIVVTPSRLIEVAKGQVDYILGSNPMNMSYMVGYGDRFPQKIHHRASSMPSLDKHPDHIGCKGGTPYYLSDNPNPNLLIGAIVGGPDINDSYVDSRALFVHSEPTTYINAPMVGVLAFFNAHSS
ncbi:hypothetical protein Sjap_020468 [Stephania japonica]|uniref:Endoglucanase n=1 Tax=Stephania japonica TaxID=461633 RepID=A0AAP0I0P9_9MAGN